MRHRPLSIGTDDFKKLVGDGCYYVDKTLLIKEILDRKSEATLFTRPRRFGKTLNLSMLRYFFEDTGDDARNRENAGLFEGMKIADAGEIYTSQMQKYPVIFLTLKSAKQADFAYAFRMMRESIAKEFERHEDVVIPALKNQEKKEKYRRIRAEKADDAEYYTALAFLSDCLSEACGRRSIILLDEYDVPLESAYYGGFYDETVMFIRSLFESALKSNPHLQFAVITGCLRISRESIFTGLNNLDVVSLLDRRYGEYFGFTEDEVRSMMQYYGSESRFSDMRKWYDGYRFGTAEVYNPWSVIKFQSDLQADPQAFPKSYWSNTSSNSIVRDLIRDADEETREELETLLSGGTIRKPVHEDITYADIRKNKENLWNFLFFTGYLKKTGESMEQRRIQLDLTIPNLEVRSIYEEKIRGWFEEEIEKKDLGVLQRALLSGEAETAEEELRKLLAETISYLDSGEAFYHGFLLGVLANMGGGYLAKSNREAGNGRYDICVYHRSDYRKPAVIIELKVTKQARRLEDCAREALEQITARNYDAWLRELGYEECWHAGIGFFRKNCAVKMVKKTVEEPA